MSLSRARLVALSFVPALIAGCALGRAPDLGVSGPASPPCRTAAECAAAPSRSTIRSLELTGHTREALVLARRRAAAMPDSAEAWVDLARLADQEGTRAEVLSAYHRLVALTPNEARSHELLGWALLVSGDATAGLAEMRVSEKLAPARAEGHAGAGYALAALGRNEEALRSFAEATRLAPDDAEAWGQMASVSMTLGRRADAARYWESALKADPGYFDTRADERRMWEGVVATEHGTVAVAQQGVPTPTSVPTAAAHSRLDADGPTSSGSGFFVQANGLILTNKHVIRGCASLKVRSDSSDAKSAHVVAIDANDDLALLRTEMTGAVAVFREGDAVRRGEDVVAIGYPLSGLLADQVNVSPGSVNALAGMYNDAHQLQMSAPVQPGSSGGPLLDASGNVVGVVVTKLNAKVVADAMGDIPQNVNFALKSGVARSFLAQNGVQVATAPLATPRSHADIGDIGRRMTVLVECWR